LKALAFEQDSYQSAITPIPGPQGQYCRSNHSLAAMPGWQQLPILARSTQHIDRRRGRRSAGTGRTGLWLGKLLRGGDADADQA
jgi:hypothetical protein